MGISEGYQYCRLFRIFSLSKKENPHRPGQRPGKAWSLLYEKSDDSAEKGRARRDGNAYKWIGRRGLASCLRHIYTPTCRSILPVFNRKTGKSEHILARSLPPPSWGTGKRKRSCLGLARRRSIDRLARTLGGGAGS